MKYFSLLALMLCVTACSDASLEALRSAEPSDDPYAKALSDAYLELAEEEEQAGRGNLVQRFAEKGLAAAYGEEVTADNPGGYPSLSDHEALGQGYRVLDALFAADAAARYPKHAAQAQSLYDCWIGRVQSNAPKAAAEFCEQQYYNHLSVVRHKLQHDPALEPEKKEEPEVVAPVEKKPEPVLATSYLIYFEWDKAVLNEMSLKKLREISDMLASMDSYELILNGHTDTSGNAAYNMRLSERRAISIRDLLATFGIPKAVMSVFAFGETDPAVETKDGVREPKNRRVEIFIE